MRLNAKYIIILHKISIVSKENSINNAHLILLNEFGFVY